MRLDNYIFENKLARSRSHAKSLIKDGKVKINDIVLYKSSYEVKATDIVYCDNDHVVGRGYYKLYNAIINVNLDVNDKVCLDIGSSTGGFTQCLIKNNAKEVHAYDVGKDQFDKSLLEEYKEKIILKENFDIRNILDRDILDSDKNFENFFDIVVCDVSFISITSIIDIIYKVMKLGGEALLLIKPQFEVGRGNTKKGIVRDELLRLDIVNSIKDKFIENNFEIIKTFESSVVGGDGNIEYFLYIKKYD